MQVPRRGDGDRSGQGSCPAAGAPSIQPFRASSDEAGPVGWIRESSVRAPLSWPDSVVSTSTASTLIVTWLTSSSATDAENPESSAAGPCIKDPQAGQRSAARLVTPHTGQGRRRDRRICQPIQPAAPASNGRSSSVRVSPPSRSNRKRPTGIGSKSRTSARAIQNQGRGRDINGESGDRSQTNAPTPPTPRYQPSREAAGQPPNRPRPPG